MSRLRDSVGQVIARRVRRAAYKNGHLLTRFRASKDNEPPGDHKPPVNKLGDTFAAECMFCKRPVLINFEPFDNEEEEQRAVLVVSNRFGQPHSLRYVVSGLETPCVETARQ